MFDIALVSAAGCAFGSLFTVGWLWAGIISIFLVFALISSAYDDSPAIWLFALGMTGVVWWLGPNPFTWVWTHPRDAIEVVVQYLAIGFVYMTFRWWRLVLDAGRNITSQKEYLMHSFNTSIYATYEEYLDSRHLIPHVTEHIGKLVHWMIWWFFSAPSFVFRDFFTLLGDFITTFFGGFFTRIREWTFKSLGIDTTLVPVKPEVVKPVEGVGGATSF